MLTHLHESDVYIILSNLKYTIMAHGGDTKHPIKLTCHRIDNIAHATKLTLSQNFGK